MQASPWQGFFEADRRLFFVAICLLTLLVLLLKKSFIESEIAAFEILEAQGRNQSFHLTNFIQYVTIPFFYGWKFLLTAFVLWTGCFMFGHKFSFGNTWSVVMASELVFFIPELLKIGWFTFVESDPSIWEVKAFYPFSLLQLTDWTQIDERYYYPLKTLNLFEVIYWLLLAKGIQHFTPKIKNRAYLIVAGSYVVGLMLWLLFFLIVFK